jgi:hypothetical protein
MSYTYTSGATYTDSSGTTWKIPDNFTPTATTSPEAIAAASSAGILSSSSSSSKSSSSSSGSSSSGSSSSGSSNYTYFDWEDNQVPTSSSSSSSSPILFGGSAGTGTTTDFGTAPGQISDITYSIPATDNRTISYISESGDLLGQSDVFSIDAMLQSLQASFPGQVINMADTPGGTSEIQKIIKSSNSGGIFDIVGSAGDTINDIISAPGNAANTVENATKEIIYVIKEALGDVKDVGGDIKSAGGQAIDIGKYALLGVGLLAAYYISKK